MASHEEVDNNLSFYQFDPLLGFWGTPNVRRKIRYTLASDSVFEVKHNSRGNRDIELNAVPAKDRIMVLGGSNAWGAGLERGDRFSDVLRDRYGRATINCGHCSVGLDQACLYLLTKGKEHSPKVIIVEQHPWALHRVINNFVAGYVKPVFNVENEVLQLKKIGRLQKYKLFRNIEGPYLSFRKHYMEYRAGIRVQKQYDHNSEVIFEDPLFLAWKQQYYCQMYEIVEHLIRVFKVESQKLGARLIFLFGPTKPELESELQLGLVDYHIPRRRLIEFCQKYNVEYLDLLEPMLSEQANGGQVIFKDSHLTPLGNRIIAQELARAI